MTTIWITSNNLLENKPYICFEVDCMVKLYLSHYMKLHELSPVRYICDIPLVRSIRCTNLY